MSVSGAELARRELGAFLRHRRERLATGPRRPRARARGATRESVAEAAGISAPWYARVEQARAPGLTEATLGTICTALALDPVESAYASRLLEASRGEPPADDARKETAAGSTVDAPTVRALISELRDAPAYVIDERWRVLAFNEASTLLHGKLDESAQTGGEVARNCLWWHFTNASFRRSLQDAERVLAYLAALFRHSTARAAGEPWRTALIEAVSAHSDDFARLWRAQGVTDWNVTEKRFEHPTVGTLRFTNVSHTVEPMARSGSAPGGGPTLRVVSYLPVEGSGTRAKVEAFVARTGGSGA